MDVHCDHQIIAVGPDRMRTLDNATGGDLVDAVRTGTGQPWTITAPGVADVTAPDRPTAITAMTQQALASLLGSGYSTFVPDGLNILP